MAITRTIATSRYTIGIGTQQSLAFDGVASFATVPVVPAVTGFCIAFWAKTNKAALTQAIADWQTANDTDGFIARFDSANDIVAVLCTGASPVAILQKGSNTFAPGKWFHVAITYTPGSAKLYIGGILAGTPNSTVTVTTTASTLTLGKDAYAASRFFNGALKNFTLHNTTTQWTQAQINDLMYSNIIPAGAIQWGMNGVATDQNGTNAMTLSGTSYSNDVPFKPRGSAGTRSNATVTPATMLDVRGNNGSTKVVPIDPSKMIIGSTSDWSAGWKVTLHPKGLTGNNDNHCLGNFGLNFGGNLGYAFYVGSNTGTLGAVIGNTFYTSAYTGLTYGVEHWIIFTLTGTTLKGYVDGVLQWTQTVVRKANDTSSRFLLSESGGPSASARNVYGFAKDIFSTLLLISSTDITNIISNNIFPTCDFHYQLNEGSGSASADQSGNANNGIITGGIWRTVGRQITG